jgi:hypothetical protein
MPFKGTWLRQQWQADPDRFTVEGAPDPDHGNRDEPSNAVVMQDAPLLQGGGEIVTDACMEQDYPTAKTVVIDETPVGHGPPPQQAGHGYGGWFGFLDATEGYGNGILGALRGRDLGAARRGTVQVGRPWRFWDDTYFGTTTEGADGSPLADEGGPAVLVRGLNAYAANNGDGGRTRGNGSHSWRVNTPTWKRGLYLGSNVQRGAFHPPIRTHHDMKYNQPNIVTIVGDAPPPARPDKYSSPFGSLQQFGLNIPGRRRPAMRRQPEPWDNEIVTANTDRARIEGQVADSLVVP